VLNKGQFANFAQNWLPWQCSLRYGSIKSNKYLLFSEKIMKIGPVDREMLWLKLKKKKLIQAKYIVWSQVC